MALLDKSGIVDGQRIDGVHVSNIYDALNESGSFEVQATGSFTGSFTGTFIGTATSASYAISASHEITTEIFSSTASLVNRADQPLIKSFSQPLTSSAAFKIGPETNATGLSSFAQGSGSDATGDYSHAQGRGTIASGFAAHAEGLTSKADGSYSHAEGRSTLANGSYSHTQGRITTASGDYTHAGGYGTVASGNYQLVAGQFNVSSSDSAAFIIGDGADANNRSNILFAGNNKIELNQPVTASADISSSANMFADRSVFNRVTTPLISSTTTVQIDNNLSGSAITTASFGHFIGDGSGLTGAGTTVVANPGGSPGTALSTITIGASDFSVGGGSGTQIASGSTSASADPGTGIVVNHSGSTAFSVIGDVGTLFSVDDDLSGTLFTANDVSGLPVLKADASGEVYLGKSPQSLYTTAIISSNTANITQSIHGLSTSSYDGAFIEYTAISGSAGHHNARAGSIMAIWTGSAVNFTETTTTDHGDTSNLIMQVAISQSQAQIQSYSTTAGYKIKTIIKAI